MSLQVAVRLALAPILVVAATATPELLYAQDLEQEENYSVATEETESAPSSSARDRSVFEIVVLGERSAYRGAESVAATRIATDLRDLPINVSIVTAELMQEAQILDIIDTLRYKGVNANRDVRFNSMFIRGFNNTLQKRNGIRRTYNWQTANIEQVEIVKGPASILYGAVLPGGAVMSVSKTPQAEAHAEASMTLGQYDFKRAVVDAGTPLGSADNLRVRFIGEVQDSEDFYDFAFVERTLFNPMVQWSIAPGLTLDLEFERIRHKEHQVNYQSFYNEDSINTLPPFPGTPDPLPLFPATGFSWGFLPLSKGHHNSARGNEYEIDTDWYEATLTYESENDWTVRWKAAWVENSLETRTATVGRLNYAGGTHGLIRPAAGQSSNREFTTFAEATGRIDVGPVELVPMVGFEYARRESFAFDQLSRPPGEVIRLDEIGAYRGLLDAPTPEFAARPRTDNVNRSVYGLLQAEWPGGLRLLGAMRYETGETNPLQQGVGPGNSFSATSVQLGAVYRFTPSHITFLNVSESFVPNTIVNPDGTTLPLEKGLGVELGWRAFFLDERVSLTSTVYRTVRDNMARLDTGRTFDEINNPGQISFFTTSGKEEVRGLELELFLRPFDNYEMSLSYNWLPYARVISFENRPDIEGNRLRYAPKHGVGFWNRLTFPGRFSDFYMIGGLTFQSKTEWDADKNFTTAQFDSFTNIDLGVGWSGEVRGAPISVELLGKNLTDNELTTTYRPQDRRRWFITARLGF